MTTDSASPGDEPRQLLGTAHELARRVRKAQRATWFPLVVLAAVTFAAIPVDRYSPVARGACGVIRAAAGPSGYGCTVARTAGLVYWPIALVVAYAVIATWYLRTSRARGVGTRVWPYVTAGIVIAAVASGVSLWTYHHILAGEWDILGLRVGPPQSQILVSRLAGPADAIGLALLVLAWAERNRALFVLTLGYLAVVLVPVNFGWVITPPSPWFYLPQLVIQGSVLLLAGIGFALAQRPVAP